MGSKKLTMKFPFRYADDYNSQMCIYKLCFNDHFFIAGCKRLKKRVLQHSEEIERKLRRGLKESDEYRHMINYIRESGCTEFVVHLIFPIALESEIPMYEQRVFDLVKDNPLCLNESFKAHLRTYHAQSSIYRQLKAEAGIEVEPPAPEPIPVTVQVQKLSRKKKEEPATGLEPIIEPVQTTSSTNSFAEALKKINQAYAKDGN